MNRTTTLTATIAAAGFVLAVGFAVVGNPAAQADTVASGDCSVSAVADSVTVPIGGQTAFSASANDSATDPTAAWSAAAPTSQGWGISMDSTGQTTVSVDSSYGGPSSFDASYSLSEPCTTTSLLSGATTTTLTAHATIHVTVGGATGSSTPSPSGSSSPTNAGSDSSTSGQSPSAAASSPIARDDRVLLMPGQTATVDLAANDYCGASPCAVSVPPSALNPCYGIPQPCDPSRSWTLTQTGPTTFAVGLASGFATGAPGDPRETTLAGVPYTLTDASGAQAVGHLDIDYMTTSEPTTAAPSRTGTMSLAHPTYTVTLRNRYAQGRSVRGAHFYPTAGHGQTRARRWLAFPSTTIDAVSAFGLTKSQGCILATADGSSHDGYLGNGIPAQSYAPARHPWQPFVGSRSPIASALRHDKAVHKRIRSLWANLADFVHSGANGANGLRIVLGVTHNAPLRPGTYRFPIAMTCGDGRHNYNPGQIDQASVVTGTLVVVIK